MIKNEDYKNRVVFTKHGKVEFDENGIADAEPKAEKSLASLQGFDLFKPEQKEDTPTEVAEAGKPEDKEEDKQPEPAKPAAKKTTTRRTKATTKKEDK